MKHSVDFEPLIENDLLLDVDNYVCSFFLCDSALSQLSLEFDCPISQNQFPLHYTMQDHVSMDSGLTLSILLDYHKIHVSVALMVNKKVMTLFCLIQFVLLRISKLMTIWNLTCMDCRVTHCDYIILRTLLFIRCWFIE